MVIAFIIGLVCVIVDQISKLIVMNHMVEHELITVIPNLLKFRFVYNTGAAFSSMSNSVVFLTIVSLAATCAISYCIVKFSDFKNKKFLTIVMGLLLGGTAGNLIDRFLTAIHARKGVVDFIELYIGSFNLVFGSTFNIADSFLVVGCVLLIIYLIFLDKSNNKKINGDNNDNNSN